MKTTSDLPLPALGFWAKHVEAFDWLYENYVDEVSPINPPHSLGELFASEAALQRSEKIIRDGIIEQRQLLTSIKRSVHEQLCRSTTVDSVVKKMKRADWDFILQVRARGETTGFVGSLSAYLHTEGEPSALRLTTAIWLSSAKNREPEFAVAISELTGMHASVARSQFDDWATGSLILGSRVLADYWNSGSTVVDGSRLMKDALNDFARIDDKTWSSLLHL